MPEKIYEIDWDLKVTLTVSVDEELFTPEMQLEIINFFGYEDDIDEDGLLIAVLKNLLIALLNTSIYSCDPIIDFTKYHTPDGWTYARGDCGLKLLSLSELEFDVFDVSVSFKEGV